MRKRTPRLVSVVFRVDRALLDSVKQLTAKTRVSQSDYLREAVEDVLAKHRSAVKATTTCTTRRRL